jgi:two-component system chemotaxis sensor kinase CheA
VGNEDRLARRRATFVHDARRRLAALSDSLLLLERDPADRAAQEEALRALHTLKGNAAVVGLERIAAAAHILEDAVVDSASSVALLLRGLDALNAMVAVVADEVQQTGPPIPVIETLQAGLTPISSSSVAPGQGANDTRPSQIADSSEHLLSASVRQLDSLLELTEELRLAHSALAQSPSEMLDRHLARQRRLLHELHDTVLQTRLLPVRRAFEGCARLVRDLAEELGCRATLEIQGADTEIDRSALDPVRALVVHLLRNALAHGIEPPDERTREGKPVEGTVRLTARQEGSGVVIEVADDGRGIDRDRVVKRAVESGWCTEEQVATMPDAHLWGFLTRSGTSTQDGIDQIAGRGVGLDAVRQGVESLRGRLEIESLAGQGTTVRLRLPAMMALEDVVLLRTAAEMYAIPEPYVERVCPMSELAGVPTVDLRDRLQVPGETLAVEPTLVLCRRSKGTLGLLVDGVAGRETAVIKPLPPRTRRPNLLGAIVTGAGQVVLVLDIERLSV